MLSLLRKPFYGWWIVAAALVGQFTWMGVGPAVVGVFLRPVVDDLGWQVWQFTPRDVDCGCDRRRVRCRRWRDGGPARPASADASWSVGGNTLLLRPEHSGPSSGCSSRCTAITGFAGWTLFGSLVVNAAVSKWFIARTRLGTRDRLDRRVARRDNLARNPHVHRGHVGLANGLRCPRRVRNARRRTGSIRDAPYSRGLRHESRRRWWRRRRSSLDVADWRGVSLADPLPGIENQWLLDADLGFALNFTAVTVILIHAIPFATRPGSPAPSRRPRWRSTGWATWPPRPSGATDYSDSKPGLLPATAYTISSIGVALMIAAGVTGQWALLFPAFFLYGFGFGGTIPLSEFLWARYFGRAHIGAIRGIGNPHRRCGHRRSARCLPERGSTSPAPTYPAFIAAIAVYMIAAVIIGLSRDPLAARR